MTMPHLLKSQVSGKRFAHARPEGEEWRGGLELTKLYLRRLSLENKEALYLASVESASYLHSLCSRPEPPDEIYIRKCDSVRAEWVRVTL